VAAVLVTAAAAVGTGAYLGIVTDLDFSFGMPFLAVLVFALSALVVGAGSRPRALAGPVIALVSAPFYGLWYLLALAQTRAPRVLLAECGALGIDFPHHYERSYQPAGVICVANDGSASALASWPLNSLVLGVLILLVAMGAAVSVILVWRAAMPTGRSPLVSKGSLPPRG
jgi:hypothetical protein